MTARRPADIAADLRRIAKAKPLYTVETVGTLTEAADFLDRCADLLIDPRLVAAAHARFPTRPT